jgi:hypothetical protein
MSVRQMNFSATAMAAQHEFRMAMDSDNAAIEKFTEDIAIYDRTGTVASYPQGFMRSVSHLGDEVQVIIGSAGARISSLGTRALRPHWVNGHVVNGGYLGDLRIHPDYRGHLLLARAYQHLRRLDRDNRCQIYCTVINEENTRALSLLPSRRASLPDYLDLGSIRVFCIPAQAGGAQTNKMPEPNRVSLVTDIVDRVNKNQMLFARAYDQDEFVTGRFSGFSMNDFSLSYTDGTITGVLAVYDQRSIRTVSVEYRHPLLDALVGPASASRPSPSVMRVPLALGYASFVSTETLHDFEVVLEKAIQSLVKRGLDGLIISLHERDERCEAVAKLALKESRLRLFAVSFERMPLGFLTSEIPYFETSFI